MRTFIWILVLALIALGLYFGRQDPIVVKFLPEAKAPPARTSGPDSDIHDAVNFVKKPI